jgi:voltage-gated potassium channel Kch
MRRAPHQQKGTARMPPKLTFYRELKNIGYEMFIGALSILSILNFGLSLFFADHVDLQTVLAILNAVVTPIFMADFLYRFFTARSRSRYFWLGFGWADLLSSLPFPQLKIMRIFRLIRVIRLLLEFGARRLFAEFISKRAQNALLTVAFLVLCIVEFGSLAILFAEQGAPDANITDASDALWWVFVTITTVGYGDYFPVTDSGRLIGIVVMIGGVGLFGTLSGYLANAFLAPGKPKTAPASDLPDHKARLAELQQMLEEHERSAAAIRVRLAELAEVSG